VTYPHSKSQSSWFVLTGNDFVVDAHNTGGIQGNGQVYPHLAPSFQNQKRSSAYCLNQPWWDLFTTIPREDGDGRPVSLTLSNVTRGAVMNFKIDSPPFWCNAVADSQDVVYQGITCNATNTNPGQWI